VIQQLGFAARLESEDSTDAKLDKLEALLALAVDEIDSAAPLVASLLGIEAEARYGRLTLTPQAQRARTLAALTDQLLGLARQRPVLFVVEDVHWIDPTTLELLESSLDRIGKARVLMLLTSRPDGQPPLAGHPHVTRLTLNRLGRSAVEAITMRLAGPQRLPAAMLEEIAARTDGVPLFIEELTKAVLELAQHGDPAVQELQQRVTIPATLHDSLMARLDRVPEVKRVAQIAACIGREFDYQTLAATAELPPAELDKALDRLSAAELVFSRGKPPDATYTFKHALVRDAAANSLLLSERRRIHRAILVALEAGAQPAELIAQHAEAAGLAEVAIGQWLAAGRAAAGRYANVEAVSHFERALRLVRSQTDGETRDRTELGVLIALGLPQIAARGYASGDVERTYSRARELCTHLGDSEHLFYVLRGLWNCVFDQADLAQSLDIATQLNTLALGRDNSVERALALRALGTTRFNLGEFELAREAFERALEQCGGLPADAGFTAHGEAPAIVSCTYKGWVLSILGFLDQGRAAANEGLEAANRTGHPLMQAFAGNIAANTMIQRRDAGECARISREAQQIAQQHLLVFWASGMRMTGGWALAHSGRADEGLEALREGLAGWKGTGAALHIPTWSAYLADALLNAGRLAEAESVLHQALRIAERNNDRIMLAELRRLSGVLARRSGKPAEAKAHFERAQSIAREQNAKLFELRARREMARMLIEQRERHKAHDYLLPVYEWFSEGFDAPDLVEARQLLDASR
jgi:predicted ATPase